MFSSLVLASNQIGKWVIRRPTSEVLINSFNWCKVGLPLFTLPGHYGKIQRWYWYSILLSSFFSNFAVHSQSLDYHKIHISTLHKPQIKFPLICTKNLFLSLTPAFTMLRLGSWEDSSALIRRNSSLQHVVPPLCVVAPLPLGSALHCYTFLALIKVVRPLRSD